MSSAAPKELSRAGRYLVLAAAFAGWMFGGLQISSFNLITRPSVIDFLEHRHEEIGTTPAEAREHAALSTSKLYVEEQAGKWYARYQAALMFGMAAGGWFFGTLGDRIGRSKAMGLSVLCYSFLTGVSYFAVDPVQLLVLRFLACLGVGGVWPNAVSLVAEAWPDVSRPMLAGLLGTAANFGFVLLGLVAYQWPVTPESWRWVLLFGGSPLVLGIFILATVPESPRWLAQRIVPRDVPPSRPIVEVFRPPLLSRTVIGILLGAVPVIGTAANANWLVPWADQATDAAAAKGVGPANAARGNAAASTTDTPAKPKRGDPRLKAWTQVTRSTGAMLGSLIGGWLASLLGRRTTYFLISLASLATSMYLYHYMTPLDPHFSAMTFLLGFTGVTYFGWLPLYLPELFPTHVRSTGTGVTFNSGRIFAGLAALGAGALIGLFDADYARVGTWTSLIYAFGMVIVLFAPDTRGKKIADA